jgi:X-Pro dipeptidyl-peptidase
VKPDATAVVAFVATAYGTALYAQALPIIENGQTQVVAAFADSTQWLRHDLWVETGFDSDGDGRPDRVHVAVTRPLQTQTEGLRVPVVYETSPYYSGGILALESFWDIRHEVGAVPPPRRPYPQAPQRIQRPRLSNGHVATWLPRGFALVHSSSPGTGLSQGCPTVGGANESLAPKAVIDWLNGRARGFTTPDGDEEVVADWSTGRVGMIGTSYNGTLPIAAATTGVEGLEAIISIAPNTSYWHYYRSHGLVRHPGGYPGEDVDVLYDFINSGDPARRAYCNAMVRDGEMLPNLDRVSGDYSDWWAGRDYVLQVGGIRAAVLMAHAFNDWNVMPEHSVRMVDALKEHGVPVQMYFHRGGNGGAPPLELMNRWFTRWLHGVENGVEQEPRAWIVREDERAPTPYADYPHPDASPVALRPVRGGDNVGGLDVAVYADQGVETLIDDVSFSGTELAIAASSPHRLLYATPELAESVHISGTPRIRIRVAADRAAANLSVWLVMLPFEQPGPQRPISVITRGWADPRNHRTIMRSEPLVPGEHVTLEFDLQPDDQIIPAGRRIALMVMSSDRDFTLWPGPGTTLSVDLDATLLTLPVVGGTPALRFITTER